MPAAYQLQRQADGLLLILADGSRHSGVLPVRAFPIAAPDEGLSLLDGAGHELLWIERLADLPAESRAALEAELAEREFMPEIRRLHSVSTFATPSVWEVDTDRGRTRFTLKGEEDIHRLNDGLLLILDSHGVQYLIRDPRALDAHSRRLLDRFM